MNSRGHESFEDAIAAYALGALAENEVASFEEHLAGCAQCREELAAMRESVSSLALAAPPAAPPPELKDRVMADVRSEATPKPMRRQVIRARWLRRRVAGAAGAVAAVAAVVALVVVLASGTSTPGRTYAGIVNAPGASASIQKTSGEVRLHVSSLPAPPAGRIYEVWFKHAAGQPVRAQVLFSMTTGSVRLPPNLAGVEAVLVTAEPRPSGSPEPTRAPIIVVRLT